MSLFSLFPFYNYNYISHYSYKNIIIIIESIPILHYTYIRHYSYQTLLFSLFPLQSLCPVGSFESMLWIVKSIINSHQDVADR